MIHLNGEEYRRAFNSAPTFPHNAMLPSPDPDAAPGTMRSYRFTTELRIPAEPGSPVLLVPHAEYLDGSTWKPVHSRATLRALARCEVPELPEHARSRGERGETCLAHLQPEPCAVCRGLIAGGQ